jgi:sugar lactone lactonase YvrE
MSTKKIFIRQWLLWPCAIALLALLLPTAWAQTGPSITRQPASQTNLAGANATLSVGVSGSGPFSYQWQLNGTNLPNNIITTVAGGGFGDGGAAVNASVNLPAGVAVDASGNLLIADVSNGLIRKVDLNGVITTVAGGGGSSPGDGGSATNAAFSTPAGLAVGPAGSLFIADAGSNVIRKVNAAGVITTVAGNSMQGYYGDGRAATNAALYAPVGVAVDSSGNVFIADQDNNVIRKVDLNGVITTVAGGGTNFPGDGGAATNASLSYPAGVAVDTSGNLYISDQGDNRVRKMDINGILTTVAGNGTFGYAGDRGPATDAALNNPVAVAVAASGSLFIADRGNNRVRKMDVNGILTTVAGNGPAAYSGDGGAATNASLNSPSGVAADAAGNVLIADGNNYRVRKVDLNGVITTAAGNGSAAYSGDGGAATNASLQNPGGVAVDASGNLFIADSLNARVREVALAGLPILTLDAVSASTAGNYRVIVTSPYGSVTSAVASLTVGSPSNQNAAILMSVPVVASGNLLLGFSLSQTPAASFTLLQTPNLTGPWTTNTGAVLTTNAQAGGYQFSIPLPNSVQFYQVRSP